MRDINKFRGCLIGGAAGDALGYAVEFLDEGTIHERYGESGITQYRLINGSAQISDDTQMTLFTANGLLLCTTRAMMKGLRLSYIDYIRDMYKCWLRTQEGAFPTKNEYRKSWLLNIAQLYDMRAPGNTCLREIESGADGTIEKPFNFSKGCGGVMRVAPIGLYFTDMGMDITQSDMLAADAAALTHGHELGYKPAAALAHIVRLISESDISLADAVADAVKTMRLLFPSAEHIDEFCSLIERAAELAGSDMSDIVAVHSLGEGWVAEETLAIAVFCALRYENDFEKALIAAVNHKGDSDSTGAVTGNILGTYIGFDRISDKFKKDLELYDTILEIADDLYNDCKMSEFGKVYDPVWDRKYIRAIYPFIR